ncbi:MAG: hypothetical protein DRP66_03640 [Planctomycetota bacterium]|nr:MAG: hypothetical protein DRP66_03640 [Planctomycetota bacterium]
MPYKIKLIGSAVVLTFLVVGCGESEVSQVPPAGIMSVEQRTEVLRRRIDARYESPQAHYELGRIYHASGLWRKAEDEYRIAVGFDPVLWDAEASLVRLFLDRGDEAGAKAAAAGAIDRAALSAEMLLGLAEAFEKEYFDDYALKCHSEALAIAPDSPDVYKRIGFYYLARRDSSRAEANLRRSFQLDPYQPDVAGELGRLGVIVEVPGVNIQPLQNELATQEGI